MNSGENQSDRIRGQERRKRVRKVTTHLGVAIGNHVLLGVEILKNEDLKEVTRSNFYP